MSINTGIPVGYPVNTVVPGNTVMANPNAQVVSNSNVQMYSINVNTGEGTPVSGGYASPGNPLKILEIFEGWLLVLVPINADNTEWVIGFFETSTLPYSIEVYENTITWNNANDKTVYNSNGDVMCSLSATATIQYLYTTPDGNYACILFDGANGLATGYVSTSEGSFNITQTVPASTQLQPPTISNSGSGSSSNNTPAPSSSQPSGAIDTGIPTGSANTVVSGTTVMSNYNAQVVSNSNVQMYTSDGSAVQYGYASPGNPLKVLGIEDNGLVLTLVPINDANTEWVIGYFEQSTLQDYSIAFYENTVTWNNSSDISVYDANGNFYYSLGATQNVQYLYTTPDGNYACVLFNNNNISGEPLRTGYVSKDTGTFNRTQIVEPRNFNTEPTIANGGGSSSNNTPAPSSGSNSPTSENTEWSNLSIQDQLVIFLATSEGFNEYWSGTSIGYGVDYMEYCPYSQPITQDEAFQVSLNYLNETPSGGTSNFDVWNNTLANAGLSNLTSYQLIALYDFAYNAGSGSLYTLASNIASCGDINNPPADLFNVFTQPGTSNHIGLAYRRSREWQTYCTGDIYFGGNTTGSVLPSQYVNMVQSMYITPTYGYPFV